MANTVFCKISAPGAFKIKIEKVPLFTVILYQFFKKLQNFLLILCNLPSQKDSYIGGRLLREKKTLKFYEKHWLVRDLVFHGRQHVKKRPTSLRERGGGDPVTILSGLLKCGNVVYGAEYMGSFVNCFVC